MAQLLGLVGREEATVVRCRHIVVAEGGSVVAAAAVGGCILLFYFVGRMRAGDRSMCQTTAFSSLLGLVDMLYSVQVRHRHTRDSHQAHQTIHAQICSGL